VCVCVCVGMGVCGCVGGCVTSRRLTPPSPLLLPPCAYRGLAREQEANVRTLLSGRQREGKEGALSEHDDIDSWLAVCIWSVWGKGVSKYATP